MTIFILDSDVEKCAQALDDNRLDAQIKAIAQTLCNAYKIALIKQYPTMDEQCTEEYKLKCIDMPLGVSDKYKEFTQWARECVANYKYPVKLAQACCEELNFRFQGLSEKQINIEKILLWAQDNMPDLPRYGLFNTTELSPDRVMTPFPLVMPKKHIIYDCDIYEPTAPVCIIESYRNYYAAKIKCKDCKGKGQITGISWIKWSIECDCGLKWTRREKPEWLKI